MTTRREKLEQACATPIWIARDSGKETAEGALYERERLQPLLALLPELVEFIGRTCTCSHCTPGFAERYPCPNCRVLRKVDEVLK